MKYNIQMKNDMWEWKEKCDRCGDDVFPGVMVSAIEPDISDKDICDSCAAILLVNSIGAKANITKKNEDYQSCLSLLDSQLGIQED